MTSFHDQATPLELLFDKLGAEVAITLKPYYPVTHTALVRRRVQVEGEYMDMGVSESLLPEWAKIGKKDQRSIITIVWDKPVPYKAGHRKWLMRSILGAGLYEDQVTHMWAVPEALDSPPLASHFLKYREVTIRALEAADTRYVMLVGTGPLSIWRPDLKLKEVQGHSGVMEKRWVVWPMPNPVTVLREPMLQGAWRQDLYKFLDMVRENETFHLMTKCVMTSCTNGVLMYDKDGIGHCREHWRKRVKKWERAESKMKTKSRRMNEERLELE